MNTRPLLRMSSEAAALLQDLEGRTVFEREYAIQAFLVGIDEAMEAQNLSKADLARKMGKSIQAISRALKGRQNLTVGTLVEIAVVLGKTVDLTVVDLPKVEVCPESRAFESRRWTARMEESRPTSSFFHLNVPSKDAKGADASEATPCFV